MVVPKFIESPRLESLKIEEDKSYKTKIWEGKVKLMSIKFLMKFSSISTCVAINFAIHILIDTMLNVIKGGISWSRYIVFKGTQAFFFFPVHIVDAMASLTTFFYEAKLDDIYIAHDALTSSDKKDDVVALYIFLLCDGTNYFLQPPARVTNLFYIFHLYIQNRSLFILNVYN